MARILVDADACPVRDEVFKVALRRRVPVLLVTNSYLRVPDHPLISRKIVSDGFDAADDWIAAEAGAGCVVVTADIPLADRCLKAGAQVISPAGRPFTDDRIGALLAARAILAERRVGVAGIGAGGPAPFTPADRSRFLSALDSALERAG
jgi:hypothetical protein